LNDSDFNLQKWGRGDAYALPHDGDITANHRHEHNYLEDQR